MSKKNTLRDLYLEQLQDLYSAETQLLDALPKMAFKARHTALKQAFGEHLEETKGHVERLEEIFASHPSVEPDAHKCKAMKGLIKEGKEALKESGDSEIVDAHLIAAAYRVEYYEMAAYETAISLARTLNEAADVKLLEKSLAEERNASGELRKIADGGARSEGLLAEAVNR
jgi:ferritin-like metal-binding protein YciE